MGNSYIRRKISHPVGFWHWKDIWMVAKTPRKNAGSRSRRAHHKNGFIDLLVHFSLFFELRCHSPFAMASFQRSAFGASRSCLPSSTEERKTRLSNLPD